MEFAAHDGTLFSTQKDVTRYNQKIYNQRLSDISDMLSDVSNESIPRFLNDNLSLFRGLIMMKDTL